MFLDETTLSMGERTCLLWLESLDSALPNGFRLPESAVEVDGEVVVRGVGYG